MVVERFFIWPLLAIGYGSIVVALVHSLTNTWSGAASLGMLFSVVIVAPSVVGYAGYLWRKNLLQGLRRWEAAACAAFPIAMLALVGCALVVGKVRWGA